MPTVAEVPPSATTPTQEAEPEPTRPPREELRAPNGFKVGLVTDGGKIDSGGSSQPAYEAMLLAATEFDFTTAFIETVDRTQFTSNIQTLIDQECNVIVTTGLLITGATYDAAQNNPNLFFIGVDQSFSEPPPNLVGILYREDQAGFLAGALAGMMTESGVVGIVAGVDIPPMLKFRNGFNHGVRFVNPEAVALGVYIPTFADAETGAATARHFVTLGADVLFAVGGSTGQGALEEAAREGAWVIGAEEDVYYTLFEGGARPGADRLLSSMVKHIDLGVYAQIKEILQGSFAGGGHFFLDVSNGGITYGPFHQAEEQIPAAVKERLEEIRVALADGSLKTGVDPASGAVIPSEVPQPEPFEQSRRTQ
ncbi:MAG: BMP family protein [Anaerolineae bacterium]